MCGFGEYGYMSEYIASPKSGGINFYGWPGTRGAGTGICS